MHASFVGSTSVRGNEWTQEYLINLVGFLELAHGKPCCSKKSAMYRWQTYNELTYVVENVLIQAKYHSI